MMKTILRSVLKDITKDRVWLGVDLRNELLPTLIHLYVSVGFSPDGIQNITKSGLYPKFPFLSLSYNKLVPLTPDQIKDNEKITIKMVREYIQNQGKCSMNIVITSDLMKKIYDTYIQKNYEYGGIMGVKSINENNYILGLAAITKGSEKDFEVKTPNYYITWHTHPFICYVKNLCYIGWPSGTDMGLIVSGYETGQIAHVLFSNEGTYVLQLSPQMMEFMRAMEPACVQNLDILIKYYFEDLEHFRKARYDTERIRCLEKTSDIRCLTYNTTQKHLSINNILTIINTFTLTDLLTSKTDNKEIQLVLDKTRKCMVKAGKLIRGNSNVPIFKVQYTDKNTSLINGVRTRLDFLIAPQYSACPVPNYFKKDIDFGIVEMDIE